MCETNTKRLCLCHQCGEIDRESACVFVCLTPEVTFDRQTQIIGKTIILFEHLKAKRKHVESEM
jgi:hypothetical protein